MLHEITVKPDLALGHNQWIDDMLVVEHPQAGIEEVDMD